MLIIFTNGFIPVIPVLIWNAVFTKKLPEEFGPESFDRGIPGPLLISENILRLLVFFLPLCTRINIISSIGQLGLIIFLFGIACYFGSWIMLIRFPGARWSKSLFGFTAPAYTPLIWLVGLSLLIDSYYFRFSYAFWHYAILSCAFIGVHLTHTILAFSKKRRSHKYRL